ncbi:MAG: hypothetical protein R3181_00210 [Rubricoccaceae bacterium]|nr:hypothetical protein [Rubricoccaceae bacterium]
MTSAESTDTLAAAIEAIAQSHGVRIDVVPGLRGYAETYPPPLLSVVGRVLERVVVAGGGPLTVSVSHVDGVVTVCITDGARGSAVAATLSGLGLEAVDASAAEGVELEVTPLEGVGGCLTATYRPPRG